MKKKINSEFHFTKKVNDSITIGLTLYINYKDKKYDFMQDNGEGTYPIKNETNTEINVAYFKLGLEILKFVENMNH